MDGLHKMHVNKANIYTRTTLITSIIILFISAVLYYSCYSIQNPHDPTAWYQTATTLLSSTLTLVAAITAINAHITKKEIDKYLDKAENISAQIKKYNKIKQAEFYLLPDCKNYTSAIECYKNALDHERDYYIYTRLADTYFLKGCTGDTTTTNGDIAIAIDNYELALTLDPQGAEALSGLGRALAHQATLGRGKTATPPPEEDYNSFLHGDHSRITLSKSEVSHTESSLEKLNKAKLLLEKAIALNENYDYYLDIAQILSDLGNDDESLAFYKKYHTLAPTHDERAFLYCAKWFYIQQKTAADHKDFSNIMGILERSTAAPHLNTKKAYILLLYAKYLSKDTHHITLESIRKECSIGAFNETFTSAS